MKSAAGEVVTTETELIQTSARKRGTAKGTSGKKRAADRQATIELEGIDVDKAMREAMDEEGKVDLEQANQAAVVGVGFHLQAESKKAALRINETLVKTEEVAIWTKNELQEQNQRLMVIDESLNKVEHLTTRLKAMTKRLRSSI